MSKPIEKHRPLIKRAAIYVRVSSERQAVDKPSARRHSASGKLSEKFSPKAQEQDCRDYCVQRGYPVVAVYRDIEKYRVGRRMVEPAGTRADRPALRRMLADAAAGLFELIVAWREDRLYRSSRPMLDVIDCVEEHGVQIELVKETFDPKIAPVKAWAAKMELDAKTERTTMGLRGRLAAGKAWPGSVCYGYRMVRDSIETHPTEAKWLRAIWQWYADGVETTEIRRRLIAKRAPQRRHKAGTKVAAWQKPFIYRLLRHECYYTGVQLITWDGQLFEIATPVLVDADTARRVAERRKRNTLHPARHVKFDYLGMGVTYCSGCDKKMGAKTYARSRRTKRGEERTQWVTQYVCRYYQIGYRVAACIHVIDARKLDAMLWEKIWVVLSDDRRFEEAVEARIKVLQGEEANAKTEADRLQRELDELLVERQRVITWGRKGLISENDVAVQLAPLTIQQEDLRRELSERKLLMGNRAERLIEFANKYRRELRDGAEWLNAEPQTPEEAHRQFLYRREIVEAIVKRVDVLPGKQSIRVQFELDFSDMVENKETPSRSKYPAATSRTPRPSCRRTCSCSSARMRSPMSNRRNRQPPSTPAAAPKV